MDFNNVVPPPSYASATLQHSVSGADGFSFVDILPQRLQNSDDKFEPFSDIVARANASLKKYYNFEVKTCESIEVIFDKYEASLDAECAAYKEYGQHTNRYVRGLRLWMVKRADLSQPPQQIAHINVVPRILSENVGSDDYESLDVIMDKINMRFATEPLQGKILNVETQKMLSYGNLDPDRSYWKEHGDMRRTFVYVIRIFYEQGYPTNEVIGLIDFAPNRNDDDSLYSRNKFEPFSTVIEKASAWCSQNTLNRFCNAQTLEFKLKNDPPGDDCRTHNWWIDECRQVFVTRRLLERLRMDHLVIVESINTRRMHYVEHSRRKTKYLRILRVTYARSVQPLNVVPPPLNITCKTFVPMKLSNYGHRFEGTSKTRERISAWIKATGARVLSCETLWLRQKTGGEKYEGFDTSYTYNEEEINEWYVSVIRIFLDGFYAEPPDEVLPPLPKYDEEDDECCVLI